MHGLCHSTKRRRRCSFSCRHLFRFHCLCGFAARGGDSVAQALRGPMGTCQQCGIGVLHRILAFCRFILNQLACCVQLCDGRLEVCFNCLGFAISNGFHLGHKADSLCLDGLHIGQGRGIGLGNIGADLLVQILRVATHEVEMFELLGHVVPFGLQGGLQDKSRHRGVKCPLANLDRPGPRDMRQVCGEVGQDAGRYIRMMAVEICPQMVRLVALAMTAPDQDDAVTRRTGHSNLFKECQVVRVLFLSVGIMRLAAIWCRNCCAASGAISWVEAPLRAGCVRKTFAPTWSMATMMSGAAFGGICMALPVGPAPVSFRSGTHVKRLSVRRPLVISSRGLSVCGVGCRTR